MKKYIFLILTLLFITFMGCGNNMNGDGKDVTGFCNCNDAETSFEVTDLQGTVNFNGEVQQWYISVPTEGTIDEVRIFFLCNIQDAYKEQGKRIVFSGKASDFEGSISMIGGYQYYCIELTKINNL
ncbi:MAG: hypothetical protein LBE91_20015 [Tannerella sp.]|nr:hypothetical protein [Tannerella sp.]